MRRLSRAVSWGMIAGGACLALLAVATSVNSQPPVKADAAEDPAPPAGQTYTGTKACASCHFKQFTAWKKTKHAKEAWESVPEKYRADKECLPCHSTGYGQETGFKDAESTPNLVGTGCEACHGPGSKHDEVSKKYKDKKKLSPEEDKEVRDTIYKILPHNVCSSCHASQGHVAHPKYDKE